MHTCAPSRSSNVISDGRGEPGSPSTSASPEWAWTMKSVPSGGAALPQIPPHAEACAYTNSGRIRARCSASSR